ncbi:ATP-binding protein [Actinokineospora pegani]|uniref:ATP-binding protein n=1 Tax=Actinokineospora pegani TaxID=2654637 RepID=UPI0018D315BD|nr:ATP-binding protein [Actinokineospora pegani]
MLTFIVPANADQLPLVRHRVGSWLASHRVPIGARRDSVSTVDEAVSNSIEHAYCDTEDAGLVAITVQATNDEVLISVADHGDWPSGADERGLGLTVIEGLAEDVELAREGGRTTLSARIARGKRATRGRAWAPEQRGVDESTRSPR